ncbi:MAG: hypothetical protein Q7J44_03590 [Pseudotabrizicola sp.]|uniref:hypothetical protein n=1 Tax=Pseudotabrizicola sp. TaxID=2939647 RepID=UPI00271DEEDF|nr:hypothetical protein [Pseudotabrizicola sp.]MDO9637605.1 hypothetical protein [Pseudotabrizicola sp.]
MTKKSSVVEALVNQQIAAETAGLERLLRHFRLMDKLAAIIMPLGIPFDLKNSFVAAHAWYLIGPELASDHPVYLGRGRGRPKRVASKHVVRHAFVEQVRLEIQKAGFSITDVEIIELAQEHKSPLFAHSTVRGLKNSVTKGRNILRKPSEE